MAKRTNDGDGDGDDAFGERHAAHHTLHAVKKRRATGSSLPAVRATERHAGRKEDQSAMTQRHLSDRLADAAQLSVASETAVVCLRRQRQRVVAICASASSPSGITIRRTGEHKTKQMFMATPQQVTKLRVLLEMIAQFRIHLLQFQKAQMEPDGFARVWRRLDRVIAKANSVGNPEKRIQYVQRKLRRAIAIANKVPTRTIDEEAANCDKADDELGASSPEAVSPAAETSAAAHSESLTVEFPPHQWIPPILLKMYEQVERGGRDYEASEALRVSTRELMLSMRTTNPFSHLQMLYREPPPAAAHMEWEVRQNATVQSITAALTASLTPLHRLAFWLTSPLSLHTKPVACWHRFSDVIESIRRLSVHFHVVVLYLYSVAMGREDASATEDSIARQVAIQCQLDDLRKAYDLNPQLMTSSDRLVRQSYAYFPELLAFLHKWRQEPTIHAYGFSSSDVANEYIVNFHWTERRDQRTLAELSTHLKELYHLWRESRLGTRDFTVMPIQRIGQLEYAMKERLRAAIDLLYHHNVAHWIRNRHNLGYRIDKLRIKASECSAAEEEKWKENSPDPSLNPTKDESGQAEDKAMPTSHEHESKHEVGESGNKVAAASSYHKHEVKPPKEELNQQEENGVASRTLREDENPKAKVDVKCHLEKPPKSRREAAPKRTRQFRAPGVFNASEKQSSSPSLRSKPPKVQCDSASNSNGVAQEKALNNYAADYGSSGTMRLTGQVHLNDIFAWTDEEIDAYEQEKEHVYQLQQKLLALREKLALETSIDDAKRTWNARKLPSRPKHSMSLLEGWTRIRGVAELAVRHAEEIALHGAAEALIQRPSLRVDTNESSTDDASATTTTRTTEPGALTDDSKTPLDAAAMQVDLRELKVTIGASRTSIDEMLKSYDGEKSSEWRNHLLFFAEASKNLLQIVQQQVPSLDVREVEGDNCGNEDPGKSAERSEAG
ncbi:hypothetical protein FI667_g14310, partial [Globisporangium splendens]